jgi:hypothetical protein
MLGAPAFSASCGGSPSFGAGSGGSVGVGGLLAAGGVAIGGASASGGASTSGGNGSGGAVASGGQNAGGNTASGGNASGGATTGSGGAAAECTDVQLPDHQGEPCSQWAEWGQCEEDYVLDYCDKSCGRCTDSGGAGGSTASGGGENGAGGSLGNDNPWGNVTGGQQGWASRYWDCCKQSCGWSTNAGGNPVKSCDGSGDNKVNADVQSACSGGSSTTCNSFVPEVYSESVAFGFVASHVQGAACGKCYQLQFTGSSHNGGADPGSQALKDKVMIVMSTNIGGDVIAGQMDLLIPGGGTGALYGCGTAWGVQQGSSELGAQYGGLRSGCSGDLNSIKSCVAQKCTSLFQSRGLDEMYEGCMWYVDWFEAADNPTFNYKDIDCPQEIRSMAY